MKDYIYCLREINAEPFYVGRTNNMERRLAEHRSGSKRGLEAKYQYIRKLYKANSDFEMVLLAEVDETSKNFEDFYVYLLIMDGYDLQNMRAGDSVATAERDAMLQLKGRGVVFKTAEDFLTGREIEIKEAIAKKKADRLLSRTRKQEYENSKESNNRWVVSGAYANGDYKIEEEPFVEPEKEISQGLKDIMARIKKKGM